MSISTAELVLAIANSFMGASRGSAKHKEIIRVYNTVRPHGYTMSLSDPWCAAFWSACQIMAGNTQKEVPMSASCTQIITDAKALGIWEEDESITPKKGYGTIYDWQDSGKGNNVGDPDHIGTVEYVSGNTIHVIEGNKGSGVVGEREIAVNGRYLRGFVAPQYKALVKSTYKPKEPYQGDVPSAVIQYGASDKNVVKLQTFLNWILGLNLATDGSAGRATIQALIDYQYTYGLEADGAYGSKSKAKANELVEKYKMSDNYRTRMNIVAFGEKIANDDSYGYVKYTSDKTTHECPICHNHPKGKTHGWNCIGFVGACLHHGGGINAKCSNDGILTNSFAEKLLKASKADALKMWEERNGKGWEIVKNDKKIASDKLKMGDVLICYKGDTYKHTALYAGDGKILDAVSGKSQISERAYSSLGSDCKIAFRYTKEIKDVKFNGELPSFPQQVSRLNRIILGETANKLAYSGHPTEADYPKGKPTAEYKEALNKAYPNRGSWGKPPRAGASCDVFVGTCIRAAGIDKNFPRGLAEQFPYLEKHPSIFKKVTIKAVSDLKDGDIIAYDQKGAGAHICIFYKGKIKEANYNHTYGITADSAKARLSTKGKNWVRVYRVQGRQTIKAVNIKPTDRDNAVTEWKLFLEWYFGKNIVKNTSYYGDACEKYTKLFKEQNGFKKGVGGAVGKQTVAKAKAVRK